ncbi:MAG: fibronectin type III domain-containing protein, partial [Janthinobacterium lividum]
MNTLFLLSSWARRWALASACVLGFGTAASAQAPANDNCAGAISLTAGATCTPTAGTTVNATASLGAAATCSGGVGDDDVWYSFVATATGHTVTVTPTSNLTGFDPDIEIRTGACPTTLPSNTSFCGQNGNTGQAEYAAVTGLTPGTIYYVRVYSFGANSAGSQGAFTICVTTSATCSSPTLATGTITGTTATINFTPTAGTANYTVTYVPTNGGTPVTSTVTASPITLTGLSPLTAYTVTIAANCTAGGTALPNSVQFTTGNP